MMTQECNCPRSTGARRLAACLSPQLFKALCDPSRLSVLAQLAASEAPMSVGEIAACCEPDLSVVSRHLATLRDAGIVEAQRSGRHVLYRVRYGGLASSLREMADAIEACCPPGPASAETPAHEISR